MRHARRPPRWAIRLAPIVEPDPPDGLLMNLTGCARLYRGEKRMLHTIADSLESKGFRACALAPTVGAAWAMSRFAAAARVIVPAGRLQQVLAPLPIAACARSRRRREAPRSRR